MLGSGLGAVLGALPELAGILSGEGHYVLLGQMPVDGVALLYHLVRAERNSHVHTGEFPFHPCAAIEPDVAVRNPCSTFFLELLEGLQGGLGAHAVRAVRVCKVPGHVDLVRLDAVHQGLDDIHIRLTAGELAYAAALIEGQVQEMDMVFAHAE